MTVIDSLVRGAAFAPAHITGFFEIHDTHKDPARRGSRGAGLNLEMGATTYVEVQPAEKQGITVFINRERSDAPVSHAAVARVLQEAAAEGRIRYDRNAPKGERALAEVTVHTTLELPVSQGFGMSAAGALSAALATARALRLGRSTAVTAAHIADVEARGGLGDVVAAATGGFEVRVSPGLPPYGEVRRLIGHGEVVACVLGDPLETRAILRDRDRRQRINDHGGRSVDALLTHPNLDNFLTLSQRFADDTGLAAPAMQDALEDARDHGLASMIMLGNSVFAMGEPDGLERVLGNHGTVYRSSIDERGARFLDVEVQST